MTPKVGVLSAVIAVGIGALAFKGLDIAQAFAQQADEEAQASEETLSADPAGAPAPEEAAPVADTPPTPEQCLSALDSAAEEAGLSATEIIVLRSLQARREALDERETGVQTREAAAAAAEGRLQEQIAELKAVETKVQSLLSQMETKRDERMTALIKTYEAMKPKDGVLLDIAKSMKPANLAAVLSSMQTKRAEALTRMLADLSRTPEASALGGMAPT
jgi:flagellar motility protein MotE (MotC chaperone)